MTRKISSSLMLGCLLMLPATAMAKSASFTIPSTGRVITVTPVSDNIIKVTNAAPGQTIPPTHWGEPAVTSSFTDVTTTDGVTTLSTPSGLTVTVGANGSVKIDGGDGRVVYDHGTRPQKDGKVEIKLSTSGRGHFYGAGERGYSFNLAGDTLVMYNKQNYSYVKGEERIKQMGVSMPLFISSEGYAIAFDDYAAATLVMSNPIIYESESTMPVSFYFVNGSGTLESTTHELAKLTGKQPLAPFWSLGYITSKYGYKTQDETLGVIDTLKTHGFPVDGVVLDLYWYGKEQDMGRLSWDPMQWPDHKLMLDSLKTLGVNLIPISQPYVLRNGRGIDNYNYLAPRGMLVADTTGKPLEVAIWVGQGGMLDVSNPNTRDWLHKLYKNMAQEGVAGFWGDLGEPEVHPDSALHFNGLRTRQYHNLYGNDWSKLIHEMYEQEFPGQRTMTMMRAGTTGLQQYGVFPWSTDVSRSWGGLQPQIPIMLNSGLSGLGYMSSDIGGFAIDENHPYDPELYVRWLQLGAFSPVLRTHAQKTAEPYNYPQQEEIVLELVKDRYRYLPYNYSLAFENSLHGTPLARPLNFYSGSSKYDDIEDEYLWGRDILVAPVMEPGVKQRTVIFPEGQWVDMLNPQNVYNEGDTIEYDTPLEVLPLFVRAGSFIPMALYPMENTRDYRADDYTINYYPVEGVATVCKLYEDNRQDSKSIEKEEYATILFTGADTGNQIGIMATLEGSYPGMAQVKKMAFRIHNVGRPSQIVVNGKQLKGKGVSYDETHRVLTLQSSWTVASPLSITITE